MYRRYTSQKHSTQLCVSVVRGQAMDVPLGVTQSGERVGDVQLPPWAKEHRPGRDVRFSLVFESG